ncbi:MAG: hypothetical protein D6812_06520 [Deltaproteobacteria bacterium]|nr:MAG: hypothetical protein D6812_06520 [Deltaproteobacteria bacterium]
MQGGERGKREGETFQDALPPRGDEGRSTGHGCRWGNPAENLDTSVGGGRIDDVESISIRLPGDGTMFQEGTRAQERSWFGMAGAACLDRSGVV